MVPILVLVTFAALVALSFMFSRGREQAMEGASAIEAPPSPTLAVPAAGSQASYLHPGHVWVRVARDGTATVGATDFAANFAGALSGVEAPAAGRFLRQGEPAWTLVSARNRRLTQAMPLDGEVLDVNEGFLEHHAPGSEPAHRNWILRVRPVRLAENLQNLFGGSLAEAWQEIAGLKLNAALAPALGRTANDGGVWMQNFGDLLDDFDWDALRRDLFPPQPGATVGS